MVCIFEDIKRCYRNTQQFLLIYSLGSNRFKIPTITFKCQDRSDWGEGCCCYIRHIQVYTLTNFKQAVNNENFV